MLWFWPLSLYSDMKCRPFQVHHILAEVIQGGLVLETSVDEIDACGTLTPVNHPYGSFSQRSLVLHFILCSAVQRASKARKESFASSNPLSLGGGGLNGRGGNLKTPLGWLTGKLTGVGAR